MVAASDEITLYMYNGASVVMLSFLSFHALKFE